MRSAYPLLMRHGGVLVGTLLALGLPLSLTQAQDMPRARQTIVTLASPAFHGRGYVQQGEQKAARYVQQRFRALGLQALSPGYRQPFVLDVNTFPGKMALELSFGMLRFPGLGSARRLRPGHDFIADPASGGGKVGGPFSAVPLIQFDTLAFTDAAVRQQLLQQAWHGGGLVLRAADERRLPTLPLPVRQHLDSAALRLTLVSKLTASLAAEQAPQMRLQVLDSVWTHLPGTTSGPTVALVAARVQATLRRQYQTQNVIGYLPGRIQPDSFLVVSAHYDHLGQLGKRTYFPGANDNASGVAMLLELAAHYARPENRPAYSLVFVAFGAEEAGLVGSRYFVEHPLVPLSRIRFLLNLDLLGTGEQGATVVNGRIWEQQFAQLTKLNTDGRYLPALGARGRAANSDHYPFSERGVPAFFLYTRGGSPAYHDVHDHPENLSLVGFSGAFKLLRDFLDQQGAQ